MTGLRSNKLIAGALEELFSHAATLSVHKMLLFRMIADITDLSDDKTPIKTTKMAQIAHRIIDKYLQSFSKVDIMLDLSILELSLLIAIKHHNEIYDRDPFNFEMILTRLHKFQNSNMISTGGTDRAVVIKAFDVLKVSFVGKNSECYLIMMLVARIFFIFRTKLPFPSSCFSCLAFGPYHTDRKQC